MEEYTKKSSTTKSIWSILLGKINLFLNFPYLFFKEVWILCLVYQGLLFHSVLTKENIIFDKKNQNLLEPLIFLETFEQGVGDFMNKGNVKSWLFIQ